MVGAAAVVVLIGVEENKVRGEGELVVRRDALAVGQAGADHDRMWICGVGERAGINVEDAFAGERNGFAADLNVAVFD